MRAWRALCAMVLASAAADACDCPAPRPVCSEFWKPWVIFVGRVEQRKLATSRGLDGSEQQFWETRFAVTEALKGIPGATITVKTPGPDSDCALTFDEGATYIVYGTRAGDRLIASPCSRTHKITGDPRDDGDVAWIRALPDAPRGGTIYGSVTTKGRAPLANIPVRVSGPASAQTVTDAGGNYRIDRLERGDYEVWADLPGAVSGKGREASVADRTCEQVDFIAAFDGRIRGRVLDAAGRPAAGITVEIERAGAEPGTARQTTRTGPEGRFEFSALPSELYNVIAITGDSRVYYPGASNRLGATPLDPGAHSDPIEFRLPKHAR